MDNFGEPELLKLGFDMVLSDEIKKKVSLPNSKIKSLSSKEQYKFFFGFRFKTIFEYLDKKEVVQNKVYIFNGKPIEGDLSKYLILEGNKKDVVIPEFSNLYFNAKEELKKRIQEKRNILSKRLNSDFEKEKEKIEKNFSEETKNFQEGLKEITEKLMDLAKEGNVGEITKEKLSIESLKNDSNFGEIEKDKLRAIQLETQKHFLNIENKLDKVTAIYYPSYFVSISLEGPNKTQLNKLLAFEFDPLTQDISGLKCESCSNKMNEVFVDNSGHAVCRNCAQICESCTKMYCKKCLVNNCEVCSKKICKNCSVRCSRCSKLMCKSHAIIDKATGKSFCPSCLKKCERCEKLRDPFSFKISPSTKALVCEDCFREEMGKKVLEGVFEK